MHQKPDGDAMGSSLGLAIYLKELGHSVQVIATHLGLREDESERIKTIRSVGYIYTI